MHIYSHACGITWSLTPPLWSRLTHGLIEIKKINLSNFPDLWCSLLSHQQIDVCSFDCDMSTTTGWTAVKSGAESCPPWVELQFNLSNTSVAIKHLQNYWHSHQPVFVFCPNEQILENHCAYKYSLLVFFQIVEFKISHQNSPEKNRGHDLTAHSTARNTRDLVASSGSTTRKLRLQLSAQCWGSVKGHTTTVQEISDRRLLFFELHGSLQSEQSLMREHIHWH